MTSLIERLRAAGDEEATTALEQARELLSLARPQLTISNAYAWTQARDTWLRLIDGEQSTENRS